MSTGTQVTPEFRRPGLGVPLGRFLCALATALILGPCVLVHAGPDPRTGEYTRELERWFASARMRGESVDWPRIVGEGPSDSRNGAPVLDAAWDLARALKVDRLRAPAGAWDDVSLAEAREAVGRLAEYFEKLNAAASLPDFAPRLSGDPVGTVLPSGLPIAWRLLEFRSATDARLAVPEAKWTLEIACHWRVRTHVEGRYWDYHVAHALRAIRLIARESEVKLVDGDRVAIERLLGCVEAKLLESLRARVASRRYFLAAQARRQLAGENVVRSALESLAEVRKATRGQPDVDPASRLPADDFAGALKRYEGDPLLLVREILDLLPTLDAAYLDAVSLGRLRAAVQHCSAVAELGDFHSALAAVREIRLCAAVSRILAGQLPGRADAQRAGRLIDDIRDPETEVPFSVYRGVSGLVVSARQLSQHDVLMEQQGTPDTIHVADR